MEDTFIPPSLVGIILTSGFFLFNLIPTFSNSIVNFLLYSSALLASNTIKTKSLPFATAITYLPLPLPSDAPSIIPGRSSN